MVDDAIVVVENVERIMTEEGLPPREATRKAMGQIFGAIIAITLVLCAVFIPMAFFGGSVGAIYRQFAVTLMLTILFSVLMALTLTPALCATLLKHEPEKEMAAEQGFFGWFNRFFASTIAALPELGRARAEAHRPLPGALCGHAGARWAGCSCICRPVSCRKRTRATSST